MYFELVIPYSISHTKHSTWFCELLHEDFQPCAIFKYRELLPRICIISQLQQTITHGATFEACTKAADIRQRKRARGIRIFRFAKIVRRPAFVRTKSVNQIRMPARYQQPSHDPGVAFGCEVRFSTRRLAVITAADAGWPAA